MSDLEQLKSTLKSFGYSLTRPRKAVFSALLGNEPQSIHELTLACPAVDRASIYRTVLLYERLGVIQRLQIGWKSKLELSDSFQHHHHHLSCQACGKITGLAEDEELERRLHRLAQAYGFSMRSHQLEIQGLCNNCRAN